MKRLNRFVLLTLVYPFALAKVLGRRVRLLPILKSVTARRVSVSATVVDRSLFEKLRSPKVVRRVGLGLVLVMASTFAALQSTAGDDGSGSTIDYALQTPGGSSATEGFAKGQDTNFPDLSTNATWEAWLYPTDPALYHSQFMAKRFSFAFSLYNGIYHWALSDGNAWPSSPWNSTSVAGPQNQWQHAAFVKTGSNLKFYLNGSLAFETTITSSAFASSTQPLTVGGSVGYGNFSGRLDEVRIWNSSRTASQIATAMHQNHTTLGTKSDLLGYWDFNEPSGTPFYNRSKLVDTTHLTFQGTPIRVDVKQVTSVSGGDTVVTFPRTYLPGMGGWAVPSGISNLRGLVVGGGGGGGAPNDGTGWSGGGGGAGGLKNQQNLSLTGLQTVVVGQGGIGGLGQDQRSPIREQSSGQSSSLGTVSVSGGGRGGGGYLFGDPQTGGSGGGGRMYNSNLGAAGIVGEGNSGGNGAVYHSAGGGGGAGGAGGTATSTSINDAVGGAGGAGLAIDISGSSQKYAWGGSGAGWFNYGLDWNTNARTAAITPASNTGAGGGGGRHTGSYNNAAGAGGSGVVIVRYSPSIDLAWDKGNLDGEYAFLNNTSDPVIPTASIKAWTVEAWVRPDSFSATWTNLFGQQVNADPYSGRNSIWLNNGQIVLAGPAGIDSNTGYFLPLNRWTHVAWVMTTTASSQLYVDGNLVWDGSVTRGEGGTHFAIGGSRQTGYVSFDGNIDQFKVWGVNLTGTQVANSMHAHGATFTGAPSASCVTGLRAHYDFNEFIAGTVTDRSGCGRHLAFNTGVAGSYAESNFTSSAILETGTAHSLQTYVKFNRSYLTASGGWTRPAAASLVKSLVVAGGGGGGAWVGAGGGAGGATTTASTLLSSSVVTVTVGQGGRGARFDGTSFVDVGSNGQNSSFGSLSATGGGRGGSWQNAPSAGGSGGGGVGYGAGSVLIGAAPTSGQGFKGGDGNSTTYYPSGGGGGAGGAGQDGQASPKKSGNGGAGITTSLTGAANGIQLAGGGGGGGHEANDVAGSATFGGGAGAVRTTTQATSGTQNTGGGGGGSGNPSGGVGWSSQGGNGGSGVVILSYGAYMGVTQTPGGARAGTVFARPITVQLKNADGTNNAASGVSVTLSAASASVLQQTVSGTTSNVTSVIATSDTNGLVTFSGLGFQSGVGTPAQTLTVTSDAFVGTTLSVAPTFVASSITVTNSGTTAGEFVNGVFQATAASATNILASDLVTALASSNVLVESAGNISVSTGLTITSTNSLSLTCAGAGAFANVGGAISIASDLSVSCATVTTSATITTSGTGGVSLTSLTGAMSIGSAISSAKDITLLPKTTYAGAGSLTATTATAGLISISGGTSVDPTGAIRASGNITISGSGAITNATATLTSTTGSVSVASSASTINISAIVLAATTATLNASSTVTTSAAVTATAGAVTVTSTLANLSIGGAISGTSVAMVPKTTYAGAGSLTATAVAGTVQISGGSSVDPTGAILASGNVVLRGSGQITTATNATITSSAGSVEITTTGGLVTLSNNVSANTSVAISLTGAYAGAGSLTAGNGTISISGGTYIQPTGDFAASGAITLIGSAKIYLSAADVVSTGGAVTMTAGSVADHAILIRGSSVSTAGQRITLTGTSTNGTGVYIYENSRITNTSGDIQITGTSSGGDGEGVTVIDTSAVSTTSGTITITGSGSDWGAWFEDVDIISTSGAISVDGGVRGIVSGYGTTTNFGATSAGSATGDITVRGDRYWSGSTGVNYKTSGKVVLNSKAANYTEAPTYNSHTFTGASSVTIGSSSVTSAVTVSGGSATIVGDYSVSGGAITHGSAVTSSAGSIYMKPTGAYSGAGALTVTTSPVTATAGNVSIVGGTSIAPTGAIQATGNIVLRGSGDISTAANINTGSSAGSVEFTSSAGSITFGGPVSAFGPLSATGVNVTANQNLTTTASGTSPLLLKAENYLVVADSRTLQTNGSNLVLWASSKGGFGYIAIRNSVCINTNASCDVNVATSTGNIYLGGGTAGTDYPTGPVLDNSWRGIRLGEGASGVKLLSGGGDISIDGQSSYYYGVEIYQGVVIKATTGSVSITGRQSNSGWQALRIAGATGDSLITSGKTTGTAVRLRGIYSTQSKQWGVVLGEDDATVSATGGGDVVIETADATAGLDTAVSLSAATVTAAAGGRVQIKSTGRIELSNSVVQTSGPSSPRTGAISIWSDSDGNDVGHFLSAGTLCLNTIGSCVTAASTGGSGIYIGGGSASDATGFFPTGGMPSSDSYYGIRFSDGRSLDRTKIWSGGGDISIASKTHSTAGLHGQFWYGGTNVNSGDGQIRVTNYSGGATTNVAYGIYVEASTYRTLITSSKPSGDAIRIVSSLAHSGNYSNPILFYDGSDSIRNIVSATGGGSIYMEGNASGTGANTYSFDLSNLDLTATTGNIFLKGNRGAWFNRVNNGQTNIGATTTGSASGNITFEGNRFSSYSTGLALKFKTSGVLTIRPFTGQSFDDTVAFPRSEISLLGLSGLTVGGAGNTATINTAAPATASTSISGDVLFQGGIIDNAYPITTTNGGNITFTPSLAFTGSGALTSNGTVAVSGGTSVTSTGAIQATGSVTLAGAGSGGDVLINAGVSSGAGGTLFKSSRDILVNTTTKSITTSGGGNIVFWGNSAGTGGEVDTGGPNVTIDSNGGDIVVAGGADNAANGGVASDNIPDNSLLGRTLDHTARLKASMASDAGNIIIRAQHFSGTTTAALSAVNVSSSVQLTATTGDILIEGTQNSGNASMGNQYSVWLGDSATWASRAVVKSDSGNVTINGDASQSNRAQRRGILLYGAEIVATLGNIALNGQSPDKTESFDVIGWTTSTVTAGGNITVSGARTSATELITFNAGGVTKLSVGLLIGGDAGNNTSSTTSVPTAFAGTGSVVIEPNGTSFTALQTMANVTIASTVKGLTVGKSGNTAGITLPSAYSVAGNINVTGGAVAVSANQTATSTGNIAVTASGDYSGTGTLTAAQGVSVTAASFAGTGAITANGAAGVLIKSAADVVLTTNITTTAIGAPITLWADSDNANQGGILVGELSTLSSNGGAVSLGGGNGATALDGYAKATTTIFSTANPGSSGIRVLGDITSGDGDVTLRGSDTPLNSALSGHFCGIEIERTSSIVTTGGDVSLDGYVPAAAASSAGNHIGTLIAWAPGTSTLKASITTTGGNIKIIGSSADRNISNSYGLWLHDANLTSASGNIVTEGYAGSSALASFYSNGSTVTSTTGAVSVTSDSNGAPATFASTTMSSDTSVTLSVYAPSITSLTLNGSGHKVLESPSTAESFKAAVTSAFSLASTSKSLRIGRASNTADVTVNTAVSIAGPITIYGGALSTTAAVTSTGDAITYSGASFTNSAALTTTNKDITISADAATINAAVTTTSTTGGVVTIAPKTVGKNIDLGAANSASLLALDATELGRIAANTLRIGSMSYAGNINVSAPLNFASAKVPTLALRGAGDVTQSGTGTIAVANLGINVTGTITLGGGGHSISGNLALNGSGATFSQTSMNYTPNTVDTIAASFGTGYALSVTAIPAVNTASTDQFMAVAFNPPPVATVKDKYSNSLEAKNTLNDDYQVTVTKTSGAGTFEGTKVINAVLGVATFSDLKITGNTGDHVLDFALAPITGTATFGTANVASGTYNVQAGDPDNLNVLTPASGGTSDAAFSVQPVIQIRDVANNLVALDPGKSAVVTATISAGGTRVGSATATAVNSVATFTGLGIKGLISGNYTITYSIVFNSATISKDQTGVTIGSGVATTLEVAQPASVSNAVVFAAQPVVTAKDSAGNTAITQAGTVSVAGGTALAGTKTKALVSGVANFAGQDLKLTGTIGTYPLTYTMGSLTTISGVQLTHGVATKLELTTPASGFVNRQVFDAAPVITVLDVSGNTVLDSVAPITIDSTNAPISGTVTMNAVAGIANFANKNLKLTGTAGAQVLTYEATDLTSDSQNFTLLHGAAYELRLVTDGAGAKAGVKFTTSPRVEILDQDANLVNSGASAGASITASISGAAYDSVTQTGANLLGTVSLDAVAGVATFNNLRLEGVASSYTLTFSATAPAAVSSFSDSQTIGLLAGTATKLRTVAQPTDIVAGVDFGTTVTVEILDAFNNRVLTAANSITPTLIDTASTPNTIATKTAVAASSGLTTFTGLTFTKAGAHKIVFSATDLTSTTSAEFAITNAAPHHLTWVTQPTGAKNGVALSPAPVLEVRDVYENPALVGAATTVAASIQPANTDVISVSGASATSNDSARVTFVNLVLQAKAGNYGLRFTAANGSLPINGTHIDTTSTVAIAQGDPQNLNVLTPAAGGTSDAAFTTQPVIQIRDSANNLVLGDLGETAVVTATVSAGGTRVGSATATAENSVATFAGLGVKGLVSGSYTITYSIEFNSTTISKAQTGITIGSGVATSLEVVQPAEVSNAVVFTAQPVVTAKDSAGNVAVTHVGTVAVANGNLTGTKTKTLVSGVANFSGQDLKLTGTIGTYPLTYTMGSLTTISSVTLKHGVATKLILSTQAAGFVNRENFSAQPVIVVQDESGNRVLDSAVEVEVSIGSATLTGVTIVDALNGLAAFADLGKFGAVGNKTLTFKSAGLTDATQTFLLTHGAATKLELTTVASAAKAGIAFGGQPVVRVLDADNNLVNTGDNASATIAVSTSAAAYNAANHTGADLLGTLTAQASAGVATFAGLHIDGVAATYSLSYSATAPAGITGFTAVTQTLAVAAGTQTALRTATQPTDIVAGVAFGTTVTVEILDAFNNRVLVATNDIKPTLISTALVPATIDASKTAVAAVDGLATFTGLTFTKAGSHKVLFTATNAPSADLTSTNSSAFTITNAAPHHLTWITQPTGAKNDVALSPAPVLEVRDVYENPALTGDATTVAATIQPASSGVLRVTGDTETSSTFNARVTFANLVLQAKVGSYGLRFTSTNGTLPINGTHIDTESDIAITHGDPTQLAITTPAAAAKSGFAFGTQPVVEVRDSAGNRVADSGLTIAASLSTASMTNREIIGTATAEALNGVATFANLGLKGPAATGLELNFKTTFNSTEIAKSQLINLSAGAAIEVVMTQQPATVKTRDTFTIAPSVTLLDLWQNPVLSDNETQVTAQLIDSTGTPVGIKSTPVTAVGGTATFSTLAFIATPATGYSIRFQMESGGDTVTSAAFTINPGTATKLLITTQPATLEAGGSKTKTGELLATQPVVKLYDQDDNLVTTANSGSATVSINSGVGASLSEGSTTANFVGGIATFSGVKLVGTPNASYTLEFASTTPNPALTSAASSSISVMHNDAHHLALTQNAANGRAGLRFTTQPQVTIQDRYSNTVTTGTGSRLTVRAGSEITAPTPGEANIAGESELQAEAGVANFSYLGLSGSTANTYKITFSISSSSVTSTTQTGLQISYGSASRVAIVTAPAGGNATGDILAAQPVVEIRDAYGNLVANAADTVTASIVSTAGLTLADATAARLTGNSVDAQNGTATFTDLKLFGLPTTNYRLQFTIGLNPATTGDIQVTHAVAHHATIVSQPVGGNATGANLAGQPVVQLRDVFENVVTSNNTDVMTAHLASATGTNLAGGSTDPERLAGSTTAVFSAGIATFAGLKVIALPETFYTLNFDATVGSTAIASAASTTFGVTYSTATKLAVHQQPAANVTGTLLTAQPIIEVQDIYGNRVRNYAGMVAVTLPQVGPQPQAGVALSNSTYAGSANRFEAVIADGRATFGGLEITAIPGTDYQLNFALSPLTSINSGNLRVVAAAPFEVLMVNQPVGAQTNAALSGQPSVRVVDRFGNTVLSDSATVVTASIADGIGGVLSRVSNETPMPLTTTVANGVGTFDNLIFRGVSQRAYKLKFEAAGLTAATSNIFSVTHADVSKLVITTQPVSGATGLALTTQPILELRDFDENLAITDETTVVTASITSGVGGTLTNTTATAIHGIVSFTNLKLIGTPGVAYQITFTGNLGNLGTTSVTSVHSENVTPLHGAPSQIAMRGTAVVGGLVGENLIEQPKLNVLDSFGNLATTDDLTVVTASILADISGAVLGTTTATAVDGLVDFAGLKATGTPGTAYTLRFSATSSGTTLATADSNTFTLSKQAAVSLSYVAQAYAPDAIVAPVFATDSPGVVTYLNTTTEEDICTLNTTTGAITIKGAGTCSINVSVAATEFYLANSVDADLEIAKARQSTITITSSASINYWGTVYPSATGGSGDGIMTFAVNGTCKLVTNTVIPGDAGSRCRLTATKPGDENYLPEASATQTITVQKIDQATLMMASASDLKVGTLTLVAAGGSGTGALTYGVVTTNLTNSANCSIVGAVLTATTNGVCSVKATKAASTNYNIKETSIQLITVSKQEQSVAFTSTVPMFPVALGSYTPTASASSALAAGFSLVTDVQNPACQFDPLNRAKVVFLIAGECKIVASQAGNDVFSAASASQTIQVGILNQSIVFAAITDRSFGTPGFIISASSNSGLAVSLATTSNSDACTLASNGLVALTGAGLCEISATQAGNLTYGPASLVTRSFNVLADFAGAPQIISVSSASQAFTASFTAPSYTGGSPILGYKLMLTDVNGEVYTNSACALVGSPLTCTVVGLPNNIAYTAKVAAVTVAGIGSFSSSSIAQTPLEAPLAVNNLAATPEAGSLVVNWDVPTVSDAVFQDEFDSYQVYVAPIGSDFPASPSAIIEDARATRTTIVLTTSTPVEVASVRSASFGRASFSRAAVSTPSPTPVSSSLAGYNIRVVTVTTSASVSTNDNTTNGVQIGFAVPFAPAQMILDPQTTSLWISWSAPTADGGQPVLNYDVRVNGELVCDATTDFECTYVGMKAGTTYNVEVFARSAVGLSPAAIDSYSVPAPPAVYEAPVVSPSPSATSPAPVVPTVKPTVRPTVKPTVRPTAKPTVHPTSKPSASASASPAASASPSESPTDEPTDGPIAKPEEPSGPQGNGGDLPPFIPGAPVANPAIGATGDDNAPSALFDPLATEEGVKALTKTTAAAAAIAAAIAAAAAAAAARGSRSSGSGGSSAPAGDAGSVANIDAAHEQYRLRRRGRGDQWKLWKRKFMTWFDKPSVAVTVASGKFSPLLTRIFEDGAYLRAAFGSFAILPTVAAVSISVISLVINGETLQPPTWQLFLAIAVIGIFDTFAGAIGTAVFVIASLAIHGFSDLNDIRMLLGVIIVGYGPALLANAFRAFRRVPEAGTTYWWERIVDLGVLPFIGGWTTSAMISTLPALAGVTLSVANHVGDFSLAIALAIMLRVFAEEASARTFPQRLDYLHPTDVADAHKSQRWVSLVIRLAVFIFVTAALMGNDWRVWVGSLLFVLPNLLGFYADKFRNIPWLWRILPNGIPGLALTLLIATATTNLVAGWFGATPELVLWSFALLPIPMLGLSLLHMYGREGNEGEERWIMTPKATWIYRIGGIGMLVVTMMLAGVI